MTTGDNGYVMEEGTYQQLETANEWNSTHVFVDFELPLSEGGAAPNDMISQHIGYRMFGGTKVPIIAEIVRISNHQSNSTIEVPGSWLGEMIIEQHLPTDAVLLVAVTGTGRSNHCMDLMGTAEQLGVDAAVTLASEQNWSNGNVASVGNHMMVLPHGKRYVW